MVFLQKQLPARLSLAKNHDARELIELTID